MVIRALSTCFVIEEEGDHVAVIPKRYPSTTELLALQHCAAGNAATAPDRPLQSTSGSTEVR